MSAAKLSSSAPFRFVLTMGSVNLLGDLTYDAAREARYVSKRLAVPALALADNWSVAAALVIAERVGRDLE